MTGQYHMEGVFTPQGVFQETVSSLFHTESTQQIIILQLKQNSIIL